jgi:hypothetical protein
MLAKKGIFVRVIYRNLLVLTEFFMSLTEFDLTKMVQRINVWDTSQSGSAMV